MVSRRGTGRGGSEKMKSEEEIGDKGGGEYEESRAQRIKENMERMKTLGIADLSNQLKTSRRNTKPQRTPSDDAPRRKPQRTPSDDPPRRSSRLNPESYTHKLGENPEIYTEEHEKLLGDSVADWTLQVKYDPYLGKYCHQCRKSTLELLTTCSKCYTASGQLCGVCLYRRYGENLTEVNLKQDWVCPVCRGICNCSHCRRDKGWNPAGVDYKKAQKLGFKSVAHYLIHTRRGGAPSGDEKDGPSDALPESGRKEHGIPQDMEQDSGDEHDEDYERIE